jgi:ABC-2 type transport system ATP-binding protein
MDNDTTIETAGLAKRYGESTVIDGLDLTVTRGSVFALLGPNGAGKTTTVRILATLVAPDSGRARVAGHDVVADRSAVRARISLTGQFAALDELQTGRENLQMMARLLGFSARAARARTAELLERFDLAEAAGRCVAAYSGGMRRRLDIAASLIGTPDVLFLDEPTTGLDPRSRQAMWEVVADLAAAGVTVFLTTQYLDEADRLADHIAVMHAGRIIAEGTADELKRQVADQRLDLHTDDVDAFDDLLERLGRRAVQADRSSLVVSVTTDGAAAGVRALLDELDPDRTDITRFEVHTATLDDVFLTLTAGERDSTHV